MLLYSSSEVAACVADSTLRCVAEHWCLLLQRAGAMSGGPLPVTGAAGASRRSCKPSLFYV